MCQKATQKKADDAYVCICGAYPYVLGIKHSNHGIATALLAMSINGKLHTECVYMHIKVMLFFMILKYLFLS